MTKNPRGFAAMDPERHRELASMGGRAQDIRLRSFSKSSEVAAAAGRNGGKKRAENAAARKVAELAAKQDETN